MDKIQELEERIAKLEKQPLQLPVEPSSMRAITEGLRNVRIPRVYADNIFLTTGNSIDPTTEGQIVYHENAGTQILKIYIDGAVKTFTLV